MSTTRSEPLLPISEAAITLLNVDVSYDGRTVLRNINQQFRPREFVVITGERGAGKTSLLKVLAGVQAPTRGAVLIGAHNLDDVDEGEYHRQVMWIPTSDNQCEPIDEAINSSVSVIIIDEPEGTEACKRAFNYGVLRLSQQRTVICASNDPDLIAASDYVIHLTAQDQL